MLGWVWCRSRRKLSSRRKRMLLQRRWALRTRMATSEPKVSYSWLLAVRLFLQAQILPNCRQSQAKTLLKRQAKRWHRVKPRLQKSRKMAAQAATLKRQTWDCAWLLSRIATPIIQVDLKSSVVEQWLPCLWTLLIIRIPLQVSRADVRWSETSRVAWWIKTSRTTSSSISRLRARLMRSSKCSRSKSSHPSLVAVMTLTEPPKSSALLVNRTRRLRKSLSLCRLAWMLQGSIWTTLNRKRCARSSAILQELAMNLAPLAQSGLTSKAC